MTPSPPSGIPLAGRGRGRGVPAVVRGGNAGRGGRPPQAAAVPVGGVPPADPVTAPGAGDGVDIAALLSAARSNLNNGEPTLPDDGNDH